jgi:hypothetical protein
LKRRAIVAAATAAVGVATAEIDDILLCSGVLMDLLCVRLRSFVRFGLCLSLI